MDFDCSEEYLGNILNSILCGSVKFTQVPFADNKKIYNVKEGPRRKTDSNFVFCKLHSAYEVLTRRNVMKCIL